MPNMKITKWAKCQIWQWQNEQKTCKLASKWKLGKRRAKRCEKVIDMGTMVGDMAEVKSGRWIGRREIDSQELGVAKENCKLGKKNQKEKNQIYELVKIVKVAWWIPTRYKSMPLEWMENSSSNYMKTEVCVSGFFSVYVFASFSPPFIHANELWYGNMYRKFWQWMYVFSHFDVFPFRCSSNSNMEK